MTYSRTPGITARTVYGVRKASDETRTATITATADAELTVTVPVGTYVVEAVLIFDTNLTADFRSGWTLPASSTLDWTTNSMQTNTTTIGASILRQAFTGGSTAQYGGVASGTKVFGLPVGVLVVTVAGAVTVTWAQATSDASNTILCAGSALKLTKIA